MASYTFNKFKLELAKGNVDLEADDDIFEVALVVSAAAFSADVATMADISATWDTLSATWDISNVSAYNSTGYTSLGLSGCEVVQDDTNNRVRWTADNLTWNSATIDADGYVVFRASDGLMVVAGDKGSMQSSTNGNFTLQWDSNGILTIA